VLLFLIALLDIFLTVLYARVEAGFLNTRVARLTWKIFRTATARLGRHRAVALSLCGPAILVVIVLVWALLLTLAAALVIHPALGDAVRPSSSSSARDFATAFFVGGSSMSIVGASDYRPQTGTYEMIFLFNSLVGMSVISLTLTYLMQVYQALRTRNVSAMQVELESGQTGDAAELLARWGPGGQFGGGYTNLSTLATGMTGVKETHHFYPVLFYFRFKETAYAVSRMALVSLDAVALVRSALDEERYGWLKGSAAVEQLGRACMLLVKTLDETFLSSEQWDEESTDDAEERRKWRSRYERAVVRLREAGLETVKDEDQGAEEYLRLRAEWDGPIRRLIPAMAYRLEDVDPAMYAGASD